MQKNTINTAQKPQGHHVFTEPPTAILFGLSRAGFNVLPVGRPDDPKAAAIPFAGKKIDPRQTLAVCKKNKSGAYGVRCDGIVVVDFDEMNPDHVDFASFKFGKPEVTVGTGRGLHAYYRMPLGWDHRGAAQVLKDANIKADVKWGGDQYVIGPKSCRMDGVNYHPIKGQLELSGLSDIRVISEINPDQLGERGKVPKGQRHKWLTSRCVNIIHTCETSQELFDNLRMEAALRCEDGLEVTTSEIAKIVEWAWDMMLAGKINPPHDPGFQISRRALTLIGPDDNALSLYVRLMSSHGINGGSFLLNGEAMKRAGLTSLSRQKFRDARDHLLNVGLLKITAEYRFSEGKAREYRLSVPPVPRGEGLITDWWTNSGPRGKLH